MSVCCECCVLSDRGLCDWLTTRPEVSYRLWCVVVCDLESSWMRRPWPTGAVSPKTNNMKNKFHFLYPTLIFEVEKITFPFFFSKRNFFCYHPLLMQDGSNRQVDLCAVLESDFACTK
jgi:hypothetical protein